MQSKQWIMARLGALWLLSISILLQQNCVQELPKFSFKRFEDFSEYSVSTIKWIVNTFWRWTKILNYTNEVFYFHRFWKSVFNVHFVIIDLFLFFEQYKVVMNEKHSK